MEKSNELEKEKQRNQGCIVRLDTPDALSCTKNVVFIAMNTQNPHMT